MERKRSSRRHKPLGEKIKDSLRHFVAFMFSNVGIIGLVVGYTIVGALLFQHIEGKNPKSVTKKTEDADRLRNATADRLWNVTCCFIIPLEEDVWIKEANKLIEEYQKDFVRTMKGAGSDSGKSTDNWSFSGAFLYSLTVITTIGYGNVTPRSEWGKITTVVYAIIGMPLFLLYLSNIGDILAKSFKWTYAKLWLCKGCPGARRRRLARAMQHGNMSEAEEEEDEVDDGEEADDETNSSSESGDTYDPQTVTVPVTLCLAIMVGYVCGGAVLFSKWEDWDTLDGSYFCFISLSTIGFGDIVPGSSVYSDGDGIEMSFIFCSMYLMMGMALIAMCFNLMQEEVIHKIRSCVRTIRYVTRCNRRRAAAAT
ncbi:TWiK family of potassium channels protein 18 [Thrips palmi]|uniref:TWiK family of potassium channels protein 18 n=1 Tax=Thrips palmi TaxID=161013 RepID=A0A6P8ZJW8_THRPL|nr:TWiK family of potassium channels protein 18 [Thrips palmi]